MRTGKKIICTSKKDGTKCDHLVTVWCPALFMKVASVNCPRHSHLWCIHRAATTVFFYMLDSCNFLSQRSDAVLTPSHCGTAQWSAMPSTQPPEPFPQEGRVDQSPNSMLGWLLGLTVPLVHAADITNPDPVQAAATLPPILGKPHLPETGWDRIRDLFDRTWVWADYEALLVQNESSFS